MMAKTQIVNVESLSDLFLDVRVILNSRQIIVSYLNSTPYPVQQTTSHHYPIKFLNLKDPHNIDTYLKSTRNSLLIGNRIRRYGAVMIANLMDQLSNSRSVIPAKLNQFSKHLFYLSCTHRRTTEALESQPGANHFYKGWSTHHQLLDLHDLNREDVQLTAAKNGLAIHHLRPISKITDQPALHRFIHYSVGKATVIAHLLHTRDYAQVIQLYLSQKFTPTAHEISYAVPKLTSNYLDDLLARSRTKGPSLTHAVLPIYNAFKNLQGLKPGHSRILSNFNLNTPLIKADGTPSPVWLNFGLQFHSVNVNLTKFNATGLNFNRLFRRSPSSGNLLIKPKFRKPQFNGKFKINFVPLHQRFLAKLNRLGHGGTSESALIIWQLIIWQLCEKIVRVGGIVQHVSLLKLQASRITKANLLKLIRSQFSFLLPYNSSNHLNTLIQIHSTVTMQFLQAKRQQLRNRKHFTKALRFFQIIPHIGRWSHQSLFTKRGNRIHDLGTIARIFLVKPHSQQPILRIAKVTHAKWYRYNNDVKYHNQVIDEVERKSTHGYVRSPRQLAPQQPVFITANALKNFSSRALNYLYQYIDLKAYLKRY